MLEESCALAPEAFTRALAATLTYRPLSMAELHALEPDFERLPFAVALERGCVPFREASGALLLVIGDPFDREAQLFRGHLCQAGAGSRADILGTGDHVDRTVAVQLHPGVAGRKAAAAPVMGGAADATPLRAVGGPGTRRVPV